MEAYKRLQKFRIIFVTNNGNWFGQKSYPWESIDLLHISQILERDLEEVSITTFADLLSMDQFDADTLIIPTSSQQPFLKKYILNVLEIVRLRGGRIYPDVSAFKCHEDKGFQSLYLPEIGVESNLVSFPIEDILEENIDSKFVYPFVLKNATGFGSKGVTLIRSSEEFRETQEKLLRKPLLTRVKSGLRYVRARLSNHLTWSYDNYYLPRENFIYQEFIPGLSYDYKVLVFYDRLYVLKRGVRKNDFRASGSGIFEFINRNDTSINEELAKVLDYASYVAKGLSWGMCSLDIVFSGANCHLIEYQGVHFGPMTLMNSEGYFIKVRQNWSFVEDRGLTIESELAYSLLNYLQNEIGYNN